MIIIMNFGNGCLYGQRAVGYRAFPICRGSGFGVLRGCAVTTGHRRNKSYLVAALNKLFRRRILLIDRDESRGNLRLGIRISLTQRL